MSDISNKSVEAYAIWVYGLSLRNSWSYDSKLLEVAIGPLFHYCGLHASRDNLLKTLFWTKKFTPEDEILNMAYEYYVDLYYALRQLCYITYVQLYGNVPSNVPLSRSHFFLYKRSDFGLI